jgi:hypothetical protein
MLEPVMKNVKAKRAGKEEARQEPMQKTVGLRPETHAKLVRVCSLGRYGSLQNTIDVLLDDALQSPNSLPRPQSPNVRDRASNPPLPVPA